MKRSPLRIGLAAIAFVALVVAAILALPPYSPQVIPVTDPVLLPGGIEVPPGISFARPVPVVERPRDFSNVSRAELVESGVVWFWEAIDRTNEEELRTLLRILPPEVLRNARAYDEANFDPMIRAVLEELPRRREEERRLDEEFFAAMDSHSHDGMNAELRRTGLTTFAAALVNPSNSPIEADFDAKFLKPNRGNIGFFAWRPGETYPVHFSPNMWVADYGGERMVFGPGEGARQDFDLAPLFVRPGIYRIQSSVAYRGEKSDVVKFEMSWADIVYARARTWISSASWAAVPLLLSWTQLHRTSATPLGMVFNVSGILLTWILPIYLIARWPRRGFLAGVAAVWLCPLLTSEGIALVDPNYEFSIPHSAWLAFGWIVGGAYCLLILGLIRVVEALKTRKISQKSEK